MSTIPAVGAIALAALVLAGCGDVAPVAVPSVPSTLAPLGRAVSGVSVERVVDGDTIVVDLDGQSVTVRLIGIDTPETVKPDSPVECFGPEASDFAKQLLTGSRVTLELDDSQGAQDRYGRTLAYVWRELPDGSRRLFNLESVLGGYAIERQYGSTPYAWRETLAAGQRQARAAEAGLWGACAS